MKVRLITLVAVIALVAAVFVPSVALAQAYTTSFTTSITYQNVGDAPSTIKVKFYAEPNTVTPIEVDQPDLPAGAGTSMFIGGLANVSEGFQGSAVLESSEPILATLVQIPQNSTTVRNRPLSNGFSSGGGTALIATVLKNMFDTNTIFSVQNADTEENDIEIKFYNTSAQTVDTDTATILPGASYYVDAGQDGELGGSFNGSAVVTAKRNDLSDGSIVASAMELGTGGSNPYAASAFEGVPAGATTFYMPSALCNYLGTNTAYAIQNTSLSTGTSVKVQYSNGKSQTKNIGPGAKQSFLGCEPAGMPSNFLGSATVTSTNTPVIAIGKVYGGGMSTAFLGASSGSANIALPYVRWTSQANYEGGTRQRVFIAIQNIGGSSIPSGGIQVQYVDKHGNVVGTDSIDQAVAVGAKVNSTPADAGLTEFGYYADGTFGGGAIVTGPSGSELAVIARVSTFLGSGNIASEDYNGMPKP